MRNTFYAAVFAVLVVVLGACSSHVEERPAADLAFMHLLPAPVLAARVEVESRAAPQDALGFPMTPEEALRQYAQRHLQPAAPDGILKFVIEQASLAQSVVEPPAENKVADWMHMNRKDHYEIAVRVRIFKVFNDGTEGIHSVISHSRTISIPQSWSLNEKDDEKRNVLELLMQDVDRSATDALRNKMGLIN